MDFLNLTLKPNYLALTQRVLDLAHSKLDFLIIDSSASLSPSEIAVREECLGKAYTISGRLADVVSVMKPTWYI